MKREIASMKKQGVLFSENYIDDRLTCDNKVYAFDALIDTLDISSITDTYGEEGGKLYSPRDMLSILLFAYSKGITSSYKIAHEVETNLEFIYLAGGHQISRRALCEFRRRNVLYLNEFFSSIIQQAIEVELIDLNQFAIDGSKFSADASKAKTKTKLKWEKRQVSIEKSVDKFLNSLEKNDIAEEGLEEEDKEKFKRAMAKIALLKNKKKLSKPERREADHIERIIKEDAKITDILEAKPDLGDNENINLTDIDSRLMKNGTGEYLQGYNGQIITSNQFIVVADLVQDENDQALLLPMIDKLEKEIPEGTEYKFLADAGYNRGENLKLLDTKKHIDPYISMNDRREDAKTDLEKAVGKDSFDYDENEDHYVCPTGEVLDFLHTKTSKGKDFNVYRADNSKCQLCLGRHHCLTTKEDLKAGAKIIQDNGTLVFRKEMREKMELKTSREIYADRAVEPEPVFGQIKHNLGIRQLKVEGFMYLKGEFLLMCAAMNLSKLIKFKNNKRLLKMS